MGVVSTVTAVAQQHVVSISFASADATASVEDGARPEDTPLQTGQVDKYLDTHQHVNLTTGTHSLGCLTNKN